MDPIGFTISILSLITLVDTCTKAFDAVERSKQYARSKMVLTARLEMQQEMLLIWAEAVGLSSASDPSFAERLLEPRTRRLVKTHLECILLLFQDVRQVSAKRVRLRGARKGRMPLTNDANSTINSEVPIRSRISWLQKHTSSTTKAQWAIRDEKKFRAMLDELKGLIDELRSATSSIADLTRQRKLFAEQINIVNAVDDLGVIEEALSEDDPELSDVASHRIALLTERGTSVTGSTSYYTANETRRHCGSDMESDTVDGKALDRQEILRSCFWHGNEPSIDIDHTHACQAMLDPHDSQLSNMINDPTTSNAQGENVLSRLEYHLLQSPGTPRLIAQGLNVGRDTQHDIEGIRVPLRVFCEDLDRILNDERLSRYSST